jgi:hypothetical protein
LEEGAAHRIACRNNFKGIATRMSAAHAEPQA